jgi:GNAT superfamily N-acetyltransferase
MTDMQCIAADLSKSGITLRPIAGADLPFLERVYASTREQELALTDWTDAQKRDFVAMQFAAQHRYYQEHYTRTAFCVVILGDQPVGRLYVDIGAAEIRIVDIALLPEARGRGLGGALLGAVLREAERLGLPARIHVEMFNPALRLYQRLGFRPADTTGVYYLMERPAQEHLQHA